MTAKDAFTEDEWTDVLQAPMLAGLAVTAADPGGLWGAVKEGAAMARALMAGRNADSPLIAEAVAAFETSDGRTAARDGVKRIIEGRKPDEATAAAVAKLGATSAMVAAKAPGDAEAFRAWLKETARNVAEAGTEGGFLGFGGEKVSEAEKRTLADLERALA